jgi:hypothetical protein
MVHSLFLLGLHFPVTRHIPIAGYFNRVYVLLHVTLQLSFCLAHKTMIYIKLLNTPFTKTWCWICNQLEVGFFIDISYGSKIQPMQMRNLVFNHKINKINILHDQSLTLKQPQIETIYIFICCSEYFIDNKINCVVLYKKNTLFRNCKFQQ